MTDQSLTLRQGSRTVNMYVKEIIRSITKKWIMTPIATTSNRRAETITTGAITADDTSITVDDANGFSANDTISIFGDNGTEFKQETQTISTVSGSTLTLANGTINSYDTGAYVVKMTRFISLDLNNLQWTVSINGYISEDSSQNANTVAADLEAMAYSGGTVELDFDSDSSRDYQNAAVTSCAIIETAKDENYNFEVRLKFNITGKETST